MTWIFLFLPELVISPFFIPSDRYSTLSFPSLFFFRSFSISISFLFHHQLRISVADYRNLLLPSSHITVNAHARIHTMSLEGREHADTSRNNAWTGWIADALDLVDQSSANAAGVGTQGRWNSDSVVAMYPMDSASNEVIVVRAMYLPLALRLALAHIPANAGGVWRGGLPPVRMVRLPATPEFDGIPSRVTVAIVAEERSSAPILGFPSGSSTVVLALASVGTHPIKEDHYNGQVRYATSKDEYYFNQPPPPSSISRSETMMADPEASYWDLLRSDRRDPDGIPEQYDSTITPVLERMVINAVEHHRELINWISSDAPAVQNLQRFDEVFAVQTERNQLETLFSGHSSSEFQRDGLIEQINREITQNSKKQRSLGYVAFRSLPRATSEIRTGLDSTAIRTIAELDITVDDTPYLQEYDLGYQLIGEDRVIAALRTRELPNDVYELKLVPPRFLDPHDWSLVVRLPPPALDITEPWPNATGFKWSLVANQPVTRQPIPAAYWVVLPLRTVSAGFASPKRTNPDQDYTYYIAVRVSDSEFYYGPSDRQFANLFEENPPPWKLDPLMIPFLDNGLGVDERAPLNIQWKVYLGQQLSAIERNRNLTPAWPSGNYWLLHYSFIERLKLEPPGYTGAAPEDQNEATEDDADIEREDEDEEEEEAEEGIDVDGRRDVEEVRANAAIGEEAEEEREEEEGQEAVENQSTQGGYLAGIMRAFGLNSGSAAGANVVRSAPL